MRGHPPFLPLSLPTLVIASVTMLLASAALLAQRYWLARGSMWWQLAGMLFEVPRLRRVSVDRRRHTRPQNNRRQWYHRPVTIGLAVVAVAVVTWWLHVETTAAQAGAGIDDRMVRLLPNPDPHMVRILPNPDRGMYNFLVSLP